MLGRRSALGTKTGSGKFCHTSRCFEKAIVFGLGRERLLVFGPVVSFLLTVSAVSDA